MIIEKKLGISADYQYRAIRRKNFLFSNWHFNKWAILKDFTKFNKSTSVLDLGTGSGNFELLYAREVKDVLGVDYNDDALDFLKKRLKIDGIKNVRLVCSDIRKLNKVRVTQKYDLIILVDVIEHISIDQAQGVIRSLRRFLKLNGQICIITPNYKSLWIIIEYFLDKFTLVPKQDGAQHLAKYYPQNLNKLFKENGFKTKQIRTFNLFSFLIPFKSIARKLSLLEVQIPFSVGNMLVGIFSK